MSMHAFWDTFLRFSEWSLETLMIPHILALLLIFVAGVVHTSIRFRPLRSEAWRWYYWLVFTQLLFFPATIAVGVLFPAANSWPHPQENVTGGWWLAALSYGSLALSCFWVYRMKDLRWFAFSLVGLLELVVLSAGFATGMSVTGDWL